MDFLTYSKNILAPTEVFSLGGGEKDLGELKSYNEIFMILEKKIDGIKDLINFSTEESLDTLEKFIFKKIFKESLDIRRNNIKTAFSLTNSSLNISAIKKFCEIYGLYFNLKEDHENKALVISNILHEGSYKNINEINWILEDIFPLGVKLVYDNAKYTWTDIEIFSLSFLEIESKNLKWQDLEREE